MAGEFIKKARDLNRIVGFDFVHTITDQFIELHGDRNFRDDSSIIGGIGIIKGQYVTIIAQNKGKTVENRYENNNAMTSPEGYKKALRLMKQAEKFNRPIITIIDTPGAFCGVDAEKRGQGEAIAKNIFEMSDMKVPIISIVLSEGGSGGALAIGVCDYMYMFENAYYSVISPEGFASILLKDGSKASEIADKMKIQSKDLISFGVVDETISEPNGNIFVDELVQRKNEIQDCLISRINILNSLTKEKLVKNRYKRFNKFGEK